MQGITARELVAESLLQMKLATERPEKQIRPSGVVYGQQLASDRASGMKTAR